LTHLGVLGDLLLRKDNMNPLIKWIDAKAWRLHTYFFGSVGFLAGGVGITIFHHPNIGCILFLCGILILFSPILFELVMWFVCVISYPLIKLLQTLINILSVWWTPEELKPLRDIKIKMMRKYLCKS
jgi:hypothetical protein